jgi:hypothetical protein
MFNLPPETWLSWVNIARIWGLAIAAIAGVISLVAGIAQHHLQAVVSAQFTTGQFSTSKWLYGKRQELASLH